MLQEWCLSKIKNCYFKKLLLNVLDNLWMFASANLKYPKVCGVVIEYSGFLEIGSIMYKKVSEEKHLKFLSQSIFRECTNRILRSGLRIRLTSCCEVKPEIDNTNSYVLRMSEMVDAELKKSRVWIVDSRFLRFERTEKYHWGICSNINYLICSKLLMSHSK